jgi:hypothetical protein
LSKKPKSLVGYCGLYCGACGIYQGRVKQAVENLRLVIGAYGFDKIMPELAKWEPAFQHYKEFEKVNDALIKMFGECPGCVGGGGDPDCIIRKCCAQKGYAVCSDCAEMDKCEKLQQREWALKRLRKIKVQGARNWAEEMQIKVDGGYCYLDEKRE